MRSSLWVVVIAALAPLGCETDKAVEPQCRSDLDCSQNSVCEDNVCVLFLQPLPDVPAPDTGEPVDVLVPLADAGRPEDAQATQDAAPPPPDDADQADVPLLDAGRDGGASDVATRCLRSSDCPDPNQSCDIPSGQCVSRVDCSPCSPAQHCGATEHCDFRFGEDGCCISSCSSDHDCPAREYCNAGRAECQAGCREGGCDPGLLCDLVTRQCRQGCMGDAACEEPGTICDPAQRRCVPGCRDDESCFDGSRCDVSKASCTHGCISAEDCQEGLRCYRALNQCVSPCERPGDCFEGLICDPELRGCHPVAESCVDSGRCEQDVCDPVTRACGALNGAACQRDVDCGPPPDGEPDLHMVCLPNPHDPSSGSCREGLRDGLHGGADCEQGRDCASGVCLNEGTCLGLCTRHADCPESLRCWPTAFYAGQGADLRDPDDDLIIELEACRRPPPRCVRPADCEEDNGCLPWLDPDSGQILTSCQVPARGLVSPGGRCQDHADCRGGLCTLEHICFSPCAGDEDCGALQRCGAVELNIDGTTGDVPACTLRPGTGAACSRDADCPGEEFCSPELGDEANQVLLRCRPGQGPPPGSHCEDSWDCQANHCTPEGFCFAACGDDGDCNGVACVAQLAGLPGAEETLVQGCDDPRVPCARDADCPFAEHVCAPAEAADQAGSLQPACSPPLAGGAGPGAPCLRDQQCATQYCLPLAPPHVWPAGDADGVCWEPCVGNEDCPPGHACYADLAPVPIGRGFAGVPACLPQRASLAPCLANRSCPDEEVCSALPNAAQDSLQQRCIAANHGVRCAEQPCPSGLCVGLFDDCLSICETDEDCGANGARCQATDLQLAGISGLVSGTVRACSN